MGDLFRVSIRILFYFLLFSPLAIITEPVVQRRLRLLENLQQSSSSEREREREALFSWVTRKGDFVWHGDLFFVEAPVGFSSGSL